MNCGWLAFVIFITTLMVIDYIDYIRGGESFFFKDITELELMKREVQKLEIAKKLKELKDEE